MNNRNGTSGLGANQQPSGHVPPIYRDNFSNVIIGGSCDGHKADTPQDQKLVVLQAPHPDIDKVVKNIDRSHGDKVLELFPPEKYRWARIDAINGKALNGQILVDLVDRFWFRVPENMTDGDAIKLLVSNYSKLEV